MFRSKVFVTYEHLHMTFDEVLTEIITLCTQHGAHQVTLFGSRAKGTARSESDLDIAVTGVSDLETLKEKIEEIPTLYSVDLIDLDRCQNKFLKEDIEKYGRKIFQKI